MCYDLQLTMICNLQHCRILFLSGHRYIPQEQHNLGFRRQCEAAHPPKIGRMLVGQLSLPQERGKRTYGAYF